MVGEVDDKVEVSNLAIGSSRRSSGIDACPVAQSDQRRSWVSVGDPCDDVGMEELLSAEQWLVSELFAQLSRTIPRCIELGSGPGGL